uniref:Gluzincin n=1 Tax=Rhipicephalus zambeziensis TaxID=60191 RepID=A0A224Y3L2_9ACAR
MLFSSSVGTAVSLWINLSIIRCTHGEAGKSVPLPSESPAPCENFYRHVCNFKSAERDSTNLDYYVDGDSDELDDIIPATEQKLRKMLYTKIEGDDTIEKGEIRNSLLKMLAELGINIWPVLRSTRKTYRDIIQQSGLQPIASFAAAPDKQKTKYILTLMFTSREDTHYEVRTVEDWVEHFGNKIPLTDALKRDFSRANSSIGKTSPLGLHHQSYFDKLVDYLSNVDAFSLENYYGWFFVRQVADVLTTDIRNKLNSFLKETTKPGVAVHLDSDACVEKLVGYNGAMQTGVAHLYLKKHFRAPSIEKATNVAIEMNRVFHTFIARNTWMNEDTRTKMDAWVNSLRYSMGAPTKLLSENYITSKYNLVATPSEGSPMLLYFFVHRQNNFWQILRQVKKEYKEEMWPGQPLQTRSTYKEEYKSLDIPAGVLQAPMYKTSGMNSEVFGSIGTLTAEVFAGGFTAEGRVFQEHLPGQYKWEKAIRNKFLKLLRCLKMQKTKKSRGKGISPMERYEQDGREHALARKFRDYFGLRSAFKAFESFKETCQENCNLNAQPPRERKHIQDFFTAFVKRYCEIDATGEEEHGVNFALKMFDKFWEAFQCKDDDLMKGEDTCMIMTLSDAASEDITNDGQTY